MTLTDEIKILDDKLKVNQAQYDLDREAVKISAFLSKESEKYEFLTEKDLGHKLKAIEEIKFEYSPLGKIFIKDYLCYKMITSQNMSSEAQIKKFFIS